MIFKYIKSLLFLIILLGQWSCSTSNEFETRFELLTADKTGLHFSNKLTSSKDFNIFYYMYFYNGGGVGAGDFNNDGLVDLFFSANQEPNRLYLNHGGMQFRDITEVAQVNEGKGWSTGVSVVDINQDGLLDIYVNQVGDFESMKGHNLLYVCKEITQEGIPIYEERSEEYGLDLKVFGTQALFFDFDLDGDLDMFQLNHSVHQNGTFGRRSAFEGVIHPKAGDKLFQNNKGKFEEITSTAGIHSTALGYGLGLGVGDVNLDGYPDLYIGNDFHENDYLYINQQNGTFEDQSENALMHTSQFSMGVDIADLDNNIFPEIVSLDMLPSDYEILKRSEGEDSYSIFKYKIQQGYSHQFARNNLQYNNGNGTFSEVGLYANVFAADWSWSALFSDFDNDGLKDLFISNGIPKRMNDIDYIRYVSNDVVQEKIKNRNFDENDSGLADKLPEIKLKNKFFKNHGSMNFEDLEKHILNDQVSYSNGAIYADLDNDGDLDIVTNNINDNAFVYENKSNENLVKNDFLRLYLSGSEKNKNAIGAKCLIFKKGEVLSYEKFPIRGFQSSMEIPLNIGLGNKALVDSMVVVWPDGTKNVLSWEAITDSLHLVYQENLPRFDYASLNKEKGGIGYSFTDIASLLGIDIAHVENNFSEFDRNSLIPFESTADGPALAIADINHDGRDDIFIGSSKKNRNHLFLQKADGKFMESFQPALIADSTYEEVDAIWLDVNGDKHLDLVVASGGNEYFNHSEYQQPRLYLNDGNGNLHVKPDAFSGIFITASAIKSADFTRDGKPDLFIGGRAVPINFGEVPSSYLLSNDGHGKFSDVTLQFSEELSKIGYVRDAHWVDMDRDGDQDLILALEWGGICEMINEGGFFTKKMITNKLGWWNFVMPYDLDGDGDIDILAGNLGMNSRLKATENKPVRMYINDYDNNNRKEPILTYYLDGVESLFPTKMELEKQIPAVRKKYGYAYEFAKLNFKELVGEDNIRNAAILEANYFKNVVLVNDGKGSFEIKDLPFRAQWTPYNDAEIIDINGDKLPDILLAGNFYDCNIQMGRYDSDFGSVLINRGNCEFTVAAIPGFTLKGQTRKIEKMKIGKEQHYVFARNNDKLIVLKGISKTKSLLKF